MESEDSEEAACPDEQTYRHYDKSASLLGPGARLRCMQRVSLEQLSKDEQTLLRA